MAKKKSLISLNIIFRTIGVLLVFALVFSIALVAYYSKFKVPTTPQMFFYKFNPESEKQDFKVEYEWVPLDSISRNLIVAVLAAEDKNFYSHDGFPLIEDDSTLTFSLPEEQATISQKVAQAVFLTKGDSWLKRMLNPYFTTLEEYMWGKDRILETYLNTVLLGDGIFGVEAASRIYFSKPAGDLTKQEAVLIAALIESPITTDINNPDGKLKSRQRAISLEMGLIMHIKLGKTPIDEKNVSPAKPIYRRKWRG